MKLTDFTGIASSSFLAWRAFAVRFMAHDTALGSVGAGILDGAGILAQLVDTSLVRWAVRVVCALDAGAGDVRVALQSQWAGTGVLVVDALADGIAAAGQVVHTTDRCAGALQTLMSIFTVIVRGTAHRVASGLGVTVEAWLACAYWPVVLNGALGVPAASTGILANVVDTSLRVTTLVVSGAADQDGDQCLASAIVGGVVTFRTRAEELLDGQGLDDSADGRWCTGIQDLATGLTLFVEADLGCGTVFVLHALGGWDWVAGSHAVSDEANVARALGDVSGHGAIGVDVTGVLLDAGIVAVSVVAGVSDGALAVGPASNGCTSGVGITLVAFKTAAAGLVGLAVALGVGAAVVVHDTD